MDRPLNGGIELSIVIPCYNEARRLPATLERIRRRFEERRTPYELILVDDGSTDSTLQWMQAAARASSAVRVLALPGNMGKGRAVAEGVLASHGEIVLYTDADLSTPIEEFDRLQDALAGGADVAFGSRGVIGAPSVARPAHRQVMGRLFNLLVQALLLPGCRDTQCGFKVLRGALARELFAGLRTDGFAFDVEVLWRAKRAGYRVDEVSVRWFDSDGTRVAPVRHSLEMLRDVLRLRLAAPVPAGTRNAAHRRAVGR